MHNRLKTLAEHINTTPGHTVIDFCLLCTNETVVIALMTIARTRITPISQHIPRALLHFQLQHSPKVLCRMKAISEISVLHDPTRSQFARVPI